MFYSVYWAQISYPKTIKVSWLTRWNYQSEQAKKRTLDVAEVYVRELRQQPEVQLVSIRVGTSANGGMGEKEGANIARIRASLTRANDRIRSDQEIGDKILESVSRPPEVLNLEMSRDGSGNGALGATKPIVIEVFGNSLSDLEVASKQIQQGMSDLPGFINIAADLLETQPELQVECYRIKVPAWAFQWHKQVKNYEWL